MPRVAASIALGLPAIAAACVVACAPRSSAPSAPVGPSASTSAAKAPRPAPETLASIEARARPFACDDGGAPVTRFARWSLAVGDSAPSSWTDVTVRAPASYAQPLCEALVDADLRRFAAHRGEPLLAVRIERACAAEPLPPPPDADAFVLARPDDAPFPLGLVANPNVGRSCFDDGETDDAGARARRFTVTTVETSAFRDRERCEVARAQLASSLAASHADGARAAVEWLEGQRAQAEKDLASAEEAARDFAARHGSPEAIARAIDDARRAIERARATRDRAAEDRARQRAVDVSLPALESQRLERQIAWSRGLVEALRAKIADAADAGPAAAIPPCTPSTAGP